MRKDMWIAVLASLGVGAAAYYTISKSDNPVNKAMQSVAPMLTGMTGDNMGNTNNTNNNQNNNGSSHQTDQQSQQQLGPFGMS